MAALFPRIKVWLGLETIQNADLNAEFDNILNNLAPNLMSGWSSTAAQMQVQTSPGTFGEESLANNISGEIERLRFQINAIIGGPDDVWYDTPELSLDQINTILTPGGLPANRIVAGRVSSQSQQPMFLVPGGTSNLLTLKAAATNFQVEINGAPFTFNADITSTGIAEPPTSGNTFTIFDNNANNTKITQGYGNYISDFAGTVAGNGPLNMQEYPINGFNCGTNIASLVGTFAAFSYTNTGVKEYFIAYVKSATAGGAIVLTKAFRGYFFDQNDNPVAPVNLTNGGTVTLLNLAWVYVTSGGALNIGYTAPRYSAVQPTSFLSGDYWYDLVNNEWKVSNGSSYSLANATLVGVCITDGTNVVGARSFDAYRTYSNVSTVVPDWLSSTDFRCKRYSNQINVYGSIFNFDHDSLRWSTSTDLDSGVTLVANSTYYLYVKDTGAPVISSVSPYKRFDLGGYYHKYQSWRCVGIVLYNGSSVLDQHTFTNLNNLDPDFLVDRSIPLKKLTPKPQSIQFLSQVVTCPTASPAVVTIPNPYLFNSTPYVGMAFTFEFFGSGVLPIGVSAGVTYYVLTVPTPTTFTFSLTPGGTPIATTADSSGDYVVVRPAANGPTAVTTPAGGVAVSNNAASPQFGVGNSNVFAITDENGTQIETYLECTGRPVRLEFEELGYLGNAFQAQPMIDADVSNGDSLAIISLLYYVNGQLWAVTTVQHSWFASGTISHGYWSGSMFEKTLHDIPAGINLFTISAICHEASPNTELFTQNPFVMRAWEI